MTDYIHGYNSTEQKRLIDQARILEPYVFKDVDFSRSKNIIELGCGVGAQTQILLNKFQKTKLTSVDSSEKQLSAARALVGHSPHGERVEFVKANATKLPMDEGEFDGAFICWLLEHVQSPVKVLKEAHRVLKAGSQIYINEVFNRLFFVGPESKAIESYWQKLNDLQIEYKGDPFIGPKLGQILKSVGFSNIKLTFSNQLFDGRDTSVRNSMLHYWMNLMLSAGSSLKDHRKITEKDTANLEVAFAKAMKDPNSLIFFGFAKASAIKI